MKPPQAWIQHFKVASQTDLVPVLPLAGVWMSRYSSVIICVASSSVQDHLKTTSQWKDSIPYILTYSQFCKHQ